MLPVQTFQVFGGIAIASFYLIVVLMFGMGLWKIVVPRRDAQGHLNAFQSIEAVWLSFVLGQGVLGFIWLEVSLCKSFYAGIIWTISSLSLGFGLWVLRKEVMLTTEEIYEYLRRRQWSVWNWSWFSYLSLVIVVVLVMRGISVLAPTGVADALTWYLVSPLSIATSHELELQPYLSPHYGLLPLQVETHWAALFVLGNETAVLVWDYFCAVSFLGGVGILARKVAESPRVALVVMFVVLSIEGFFDLIGGGKADNAAAQYGIAAFLALVGSPALGPRGSLLAGGFLGWSIAGRYTNVILVPAMILGAYGLVKIREDGSPAQRTARDILTGIGVPLLCIGMAASITWAPMLVKNWVLVGCPLAPLVGCRGAFWAEMFHLSQEGRVNISGLDFIFYPFVWTFARRADMLGNLSPLYLGLLPLLLVRSIRANLYPKVRLLGTMGLVSLGTWLLMRPSILYTRYFLVPLALMAIPLGVAAVEALTPDENRDRWTRGIMISGLTLMCLWLIFESRSMVYGVRYAFGRDHRDSIYAAYRGYDSARWMNGNVEVGTRIGLAGWDGYQYFVRNEHLSHAENAQEQQWLWDHRSYDSEQSPERRIVGPPRDVLNFYLDHAFSYVVFNNRAIETARRAWEELVPRSRLPVVFVGKHHTIVKIAGVRKINDGTAKSLSKEPGSTFRQGES